jgi:hypothetical protein
MAAKPSDPTIKYFGGHPNSLLQPVTSINFDTLRKIETIESSGAK